MGSADYLIGVAREGLLLAVVLSAPVVLAALLVGLLVGLLQATTQIQEPTLSFVPKLVAVAIALAVSGPWVGQQLIRFTAAVFESVPLIR